MTKNYPSEEYYKNISYYKDMHKNGYDLIGGMKKVKFWIDTTTIY